MRLSAGFISHSLCFGAAPAHRHSVGDGGDDPAVYAEIGPGAVEIEVSMLLPGEAYETVLYQQYDSKQQQYLAKHHEAEVLRLDLQHQKNLAQIARNQYEAEISSWKGQFFTAKKEIGRLGNDLEQVRANLNGYIILNNQKEK